MSTSQKQAVRQFVEYWTFQRGSEKGEDQQFWNSLLRDVLGVADVEQHIKYQVPVQLKDTTKFLDAWIPETRVLIEHKSRGVNLDAPQSGHDGLTPYEQAVEYDNARPFDEKARWIVTCNFDEFRIYDRAKPLAPPLTLKLGNLPKEAYRLVFLVNPKEMAIDRELEISVQAGRIVGEIYDALLKQYDNVHVEHVDHVELTTPYQTSTRSTCSTRINESCLAALNRLCVRLVFCLYAEDADIFPKDCFRRLMENTPAPFLRERLKKLFEILDTPLNKRDVYLEPELCAFPYTNGGLFKCCQCENVASNQSQYPIGIGNIGTDNTSTMATFSPDDIPPLTEDIRQLLIGASQFDWREITPTIFGALFESTLNPVTRRSGGMVYTSVENIHKVIDPLFLNELTRRVNECIALPPSPSRNRRLLALQTEMASKAFLDPACGSGNFLTETYICLRRLENRIIAALQQGQAELDLGISIKVSIAQFFGIEINDFAARVARIALWIAEAQMRRETAEILHREPDYLPLKDYDNIIEGNALRMDWGEILTQRRRDAESGEVYVIGNPPFRGHQQRSDEQAADMDAVYADWKDTSYGKLDYVCAWYKKAVACAKGACCAFVSTNSICQGESVAAMWKPMFERVGVVIDFAHRTFRWDNEAFDKAHVHCVIVGFHAKGNVANVKMLPIANANTQLETGNIGTGNTSTLATLTKTIFDGPRAILTDHINAYLLPAPDVFIENRGGVKTPGLDPMSKGSQPTDGGNLILTPAERDEIIAKWPDAAAFILRYIGADDFINNVFRYCLWLVDVAPNRYRHIAPIMERLARVAEMRRRSPTKSVQRDAEKPMLFTQIRQPKTDYLVVPEVSSERRKYIPIGLIKPDVIVSNMLYVIPNASPYLFGVLISIVHMAWMRVVAGRLKSDYRYTPAVYNNFPWPESLLSLRGDSESRCLGEDSEKSPSLQNSKTPSSESNEALRTLRSLRQKIEQTAQAILDARARYPESSLADLYDPLTMPPDLRAAHEANDRAVLAAYGLAPDTPEPEIVAHLFKLYAEKTSASK